MGMPDKQMNFILKSFADVLGWSYTPPKQKYLLEKQETKERDSEKKIQENAPKLLSFVKPLIVEVKKRNLENITANIALVMDISGSMSRNYSNGTVQEIVNKILPISIQFDEDGQLNFWLYGNNPIKRPAVNIKNYESAVPTDWKELMHSVGGRNNEPAVISEIISEYKNSNLPVYVIFITDGGFNGESKIKKLIIESSKFPIFWQFVGINGKKYGLLEKLEIMDGKYIDNASFFALDDFRSVSNSELYSRLLNKFPSWLKEAEEKKILK